MKRRAWAGPCAIFDIDGTLANNEHRAKHLDHGNYDGNSKERWAKFFAGIPLDTPIKPVIGVLVRLAATGTRIVLATGRSETNRAATVDWLSRHEVPYDALYMRPSDCYRPDNIVKSEMLDTILADGWKPWIVFDDRQSVVDMWRERGLVCCQVAKGDF